MEIYGECHPSSERKELSSIESGEGNVLYRETLILKQKRNSSMRARGSILRLKEWHRRYLHGNKEA